MGWYLHRWYISCYKKTLLKIAVAPEWMGVFARYCVRCQGKSRIPMSAIVMIAILIVALWIVKQVPVRTIHIFIMCCFLMFYIHGPINMLWNIFVKGLL